MLFYFIQNKKDRLFSFYIVNTAFPNQINPPIINKATVVWSILYCSPYRVMWGAYFSKASSIRKILSMWVKTPSVSTLSDNDMLQLKCRFHDLRHYNASIILALGVPDKYAMERMGHSTTDMLKKVYQHVMTEKRKEVSDVVNAHMNTFEVEKWQETIIFWWSKIRVNMDFVSCFVSCRWFMACTNVRFSEH